MMIPKLYSVSGRVRLRVCQTQKFKTGMLSVSAVLPIHRDRVWLTSLLLAVLRRGTCSYPTLADINRRLDYLFGSELSIRNFYRGDNQIIGFSAEMLDGAFLTEDENLPCNVLNIMREILYHPLLDENGFLLSRYVESEKNMQCDSIRSLQNNPRAYAVDRCREIMFADEPCGAPIYGTEKEVMAVTAEQLTAHWRSLLDEVTFDCFYVGSEPAEKIVDALRMTLGKETSNQPALSANATFQTPRRAKSINRAEAELAVSQGQLIIGMRTDCALTDLDYPACAVWNEMLGVSPVSKLFINVREKRSLCYHCSSTYNSYKGTAMVACGLDGGNRQEAEEEIFKQIKALAAGDFTEAELDAAKKSLENAYRQLEDSPAAVESYYYGRALVGLDEPIEDCRQRISAVERKDVIAVAQKITVDTVFFLNGTLTGEEDAYDEED